MKKYEKIKLMGITFILLILFTTVIGVNANVNALYQDVDVSYKKYLQTVEKNEPQAVVKEALDQYQLKYNSYMEVLSGEKTVETVKQENSDVRASASSTVSDSSRKLSPALYSKKNKLSKMLARLEDAYDEAKDSNTRARLAVEISFLYQEFKQDCVKARELLNSVLEMGSKGEIEETIFNQAVAASKKLDARLTVDGLMDEVIVRKEAAYAARAKYNSYSFFKNPISKTVSLFKKWGTSISYSKKVSDMRKFRYEYEEKGVYTIDPTGLSFAFDTERYELDCTDVFEAIDIERDSDVAQIKLLTDNNQAWYARWHILNNAKKSIDITYFIFESDIFGKSMLGLLLKKAKEGVRIRFMVDASGTKNLARTFLGQDNLQELVQYKNVQVKVFNPYTEALTRLWKNIRELVSSNHDKIIIVDNSWIITGGRNISMNYFVDPADDNMVFRDTDVLMYAENLGDKMGLAFTEEFEGLHNHEVTKDMWGNWRSRDSELMWAYKAMDRYSRGHGLYENADDCLVEYNNELMNYTKLVNYGEFNPFDDKLMVEMEVLDKHSFTSERNDITVNVMRLIDAAREEIIIQNPYVIITPAIRQALKKADRRGVKIIIHTNSPVSTDSLLTQAFFINDWKEFLAEMPNMKIYAFVGSSKLHAKTFCFDKKVSIIGTYNMDYMSEQLNSEVVAVINSVEFASIHRGIIMRDIAESTEYKIEVDGAGNIKVINGPRDVSPEKTMKTLDILRKFKILKPLI